MTLVEAFVQPRYFAGISSTIGVLSWPQQPFSERSLQNMMWISDGLSDSDL
jgi:hypothetical protein